MNKIFTVAYIPDPLRKAFLQHIRDFDIANPGCHFEVMMDAPTESLAEIVEIMRVNPSLTFSQILERKQ
jgi:hypothetical protein